MIRHKKIESTPPSSPTPTTKELQQQIIQELSQITSSTSSPDQQCKLTEAVLNTVQKSTESGIDYSKEIQQELDIMNQILSAQNQQQEQTPPSSTQFKKQLRKDYLKGEGEKIATEKQVIGVKRTAADLEDDIEGAPGNTSEEAQTRYRLIVLISFESIRLTYLNQAW
jgi:hypothetical protein